MSDPLCLSAANQALAQLRAATPSGAILPEQQIVPGLRFVTDPEAGFEGRYDSPRGRLLEIEVTHRHEARWLGLHLDLGLADLDGLGLIGLGASIAAPHAMAVRPCIRSGEESGFRDAFFDKTIAALPRPLFHLDALLAEGRHPDLPQSAPWRELVLFLPTGDFQMALHDLRVFAA